MQPKPFTYYFISCFLLMLPVLFWNIALTDKLPPAFQPEIFGENISPVIKYGENISRLILFVLTALMPLSFKDAGQRNGLRIYTAGLILYFSSWLPPMYLPASVWSNTLFGFMAPAVTPVLWLTGIWLTGKNYYFNLPISRYVFAVVAVIFLIFHNTHTYMVYVSTH